MWKNDYLHMIKSSKDRKLLNNEDLVYEYFSLIMRKDIRHLLHLFTEDAAIDEPFSKRDDRGLRVKTVIMTMRIYDFLRYRGEQCIECYYNKNDVMCTFRRGQEIIIRFTFKFGYDSKDKSHFNGRINSLYIELTR
jgi:ketosteroid isomerase-like protein